MHCPFHISLRLSYELFRDEKEKRKRHKGGPKDTMEFMREIGWVDSVTDRRPLPVIPDSLG